MKKQLIRLIEKLMAHEAYLIKVELEGEGIHRNFTITEKCKTINTKKQRIYNLLSKGNKPYDPEAVKNLALEYLKCPERLFIGGYDTLEFISGDINASSKLTDPVSPELASKYCNLIVEVAVQEFERILGNGNDFQLRKNKLDVIL